MTYVAHRIARQHGFLVAFVTAAGVAIALTAQVLLGALVNGLAAAALAGGPAVYPNLWSVVGEQALSSYLPFGIGVLASLWLIAPLADELRLFHVITRSLLAGAAGGILVIVVQVLVALYRGFEGPIGNMTGYSGRQAMTGAVGGVVTGVQVFIYSAPVVILAGILLWIWLERHPAKHAVTGMVDEV